MTQYIIHFERYSVSKSCPSSTQTPRGYNYNNDTLASRAIIACTWNVCDSFLVWKIRKSNLKFSHKISTNTIWNKKDSQFRFQRNHTWILFQNLKYAIKLIFFQRLVRYDTLEVYNIERPKQILSTQVFLYTYYLHSWNSTF